MLAECLVEDDCHGIAQIQRADVRGHGYADGRGVVFPEDFLGYSGALFSEHDVAVIFEGYVSVVSGGLGAGVVDFCAGVL